MKVKWLAAWGLATAILLLGPVGTIFAQTSPSLINYQGRLMDAVGAPVTGSRSMHFAVLDSGTVGQGSVLWGETQTVTIQGGLYNVLLGSVNALGPGVFSGPNRWLEVKVAGESLAPRQRLASVPYALSCDVRSLYANPDADGDGHKSPLFGGDDCNDGDPTIYPGAPEIPGSGIDHSCDGYPFGPADMCGAAAACGYDPGPNCVSEFQGFFSLNLPAVTQWATCSEFASSCGEGDACMISFQGDLTDDLCSRLDTCGYISNSICQDQIINFWDGWFELLLDPLACVQDANTCNHDALQRCLTIEEFEYKCNYWANNPVNPQGYSLYLNAHILFGDPGAGISIRNPRGSVTALSHNQGWTWGAPSTNYGPLSDFVSAYPSGQYELLSGATVIDLFQVPPFYHSNCPAGIYAVSPANGTPLNQDPLPVQWQYFEGASFRDAGLSMYNSTRGGQTEGGNLPPTATSSSIAIPPGVQHGDSLGLGVVSETDNEYYDSILNQAFIRFIRYEYWSMHPWTGP